MATFMRARGWEPGDRIATLARTVRGGLIAELAHPTHGMAGGA